MATSPKTDPVYETNVMEDEDSYPCNIVMNSNVNIQLQGNVGVPQGNSASPVILKHMHECVHTGNRIWADDNIS